jgi:hypothetical protein
MTPNIVYRSGNLKPKTLHVIEHQTKASTFWVKISLWSYWSKKLVSGFVMWYGFMF